MVGTKRPVDVLVHIKIERLDSKVNIALLFIFITPVFINQISYDVVQAYHQHDCADGEHV